MFKYFALALDIFLAACFQLAMETISFTVLFPPILHVLTFYVKPHCYANHCHPKMHLSQQSAAQQNGQSSKSEQNEGANTNNYFSPFKIAQSSFSLPSGSPSPTPFTVNSKKLSEDTPISKKRDKMSEEPIQEEYQNCKECGLVKWVRMHHCYYCKVCVHKYDHHCVLLGICIGEANQKYYLPFLWTFLASSVIQVSGYFGVVGDYLWVDEHGYEHVQWQYTGLSFLIIFFLLSTVIVGYLAVYHTYLALNNDTTYEMRKRPEIYYFRGIIKDHPFSQGKWQNIKALMTAKRDEPTEWQRPPQPIIGIHNENEQKLMREFKQRRRNLLLGYSSRQDSKKNPKRTSNNLKVPN